MESDIILKVFLAALLGGIIGLERELANKEAGLRTNILIAIGSSLITILSFKFAKGVAGADPARLAAQIVSGIGFLGAGAIIQSRFAIHGLTTAATIWAVAAIGIAAGSGMYLLSFLVTILTLIVLSIFKVISKHIDKHRKHFAYVIKIKDKASLIHEVKKIIIDLNLKYISADLKKTKNGFEIEVLMTASELKNKRFIESVLQIEGVDELISESL